MRTTTTDPAVWIGCLACYNAGRLTGDWYQATEADEVTPARLHGGVSTTHEELWVMDHDLTWVTCTVPGKLQTCDLH